MLISGFSINGFSIKSNILTIPINDSVQNCNTGSMENDFDTELYQLIMGLKDKYASLKGNKVDTKATNTKKWESKIKLTGSETTTITESSNSTYVVVNFGEYETYEEALDDYIGAKNKIESCQKLPCNLAITEEIESDENQMRWVIYEENGDECKQIPGLKGFTMKLMVEKEPSELLMKQNIFKSLYCISFCIYPL
jgi:hypothetical protein